MYKKTALQLRIGTLGLLGLALAAAVTPRLAAAFACDTIDATTAQPTEGHLAEIGLLDVKGLKDAAEAGDATAQNTLGTRYALGVGVPKDAATSFQWHLRAAQQGRAIAQSNVGVLYMTGDGVGKDLAQAVIWARRSAAQGDSHGQQLLGSMYGQGLGVEKDAKEAEACYLRSANQGNIESQSTLVRIYTKGLAGSVDPDRAALWSQRVSQGIRTGKPWSENAVSTTDPAEAVRTVMGAIYVYALTPSAIVKWCDRTNPEGREERHKVLIRWTEKHEQLLERIEKASAQAAPQAALPGSNIDVVAYVKAGTLVQSDKMMFLGRSADQTTQICNRFTNAGLAEIDDHVLAVEEKEIGELESWVATHQPKAGD